MATGYNNRYGYGQGGQGMFGFPLNTPVVLCNKVTGTESTSYYTDSAGNKIPMVSGTTPTLNAQFGYFAIGGSSFGAANNGIDFDFAGMLIFNRALSDSEISKMMNWIKAYYVISPPPVGLPGSNIRMCFAGDSISVGFFSDGNGFASVAMENLGYKETDYWIAAIGGATVVNCLYNDTTNVDPYYNSSLGPNKNIVCAFMGTNDLIISGASITTLELNYQAYCQARRAAGFKLIAVTLLPRTVQNGQNVNFESQRQAFNTWLRANYTNFADALADPGADANIGVPGANTNMTYYYSDGTHLTTAGHAIFAGYIQTQISNII